jgi:hypothetical protein
VTPEAFNILLTSSISSKKIGLGEPDVKN